MFPVCLEDLCVSYVSSEKFFFLHCFALLFTLVFVLVFTKWIFSYAACMYFDPCLLCLTALNKPLNKASMLYTRSTAANPFKHVNEALKWLERKDYGIQNQMYDITMLCYNKSVLIVIPHRSFLADYFERAVVLPQSFFFFCHLA